jgi:hypothetical protein
MMRPPLLFCLVLENPNVGNEMMCLRILEFQALTHKDRTPKLAIFPFQVRKVEKGHLAGAAHTESTVLPQAEARPFRLDHTLFR